MPTLPCPRCGRGVDVAPGGEAAPCPHCGEAEPGPAPATASHVPAGPAAGPEHETVPPGPQEYGFLGPAQAADELGRLGTYRVLRVLGRGGMGLVFQAEDPHLGRAVALKVMRPDVAADDAARQRFLREARATAAVEHEHIVTIYHVGEEQGAPFFVMPLLRGETLDERLRREGRLPVHEVLRVGREMAEGLAAAHDAGLIHRDVKPANVWLDGRRGRVRLLDFGLVRLAGGEVHLTRSGAVLGTPQFMAPEQATGQPVDARCDLFSLGCVLYRAATGELPFRGPDTISALVGVVSDHPRPPRDLNPDLPLALSDLILKLLAKDREERPASAHEVADALAAIEEVLYRTGLPSLGQGGHALARADGGERRPENGGRSEEATVSLESGRRVPPQPEAPVPARQSARRDAASALQRAAAKLWAVVGGCLGMVIGGCAGASTAISAADKIAMAGGMGLLLAFVGAFVGVLAGWNYVGYTTAARRFREHEQGQSGEHGRPPGG
jgi:serine/threonine protein kinase